jgi:hypothetical protein
MIVERDDELVLGLDRQMLEGEGEKYNNISFSTMVDLALFRKSQSVPNPSPPKSSLQNSTTWSHNVLP